MTTQTPTAEQFMTLPSDPDEDEAVEETPEPGITSLAELQPQVSIAKSLERLVQLIEAGGLGSSAPTVPAELVEDLQRENGELEVLHDTKQMLIERVLETCKPSTSKLANSIRAILEPPVTAPEPPEPEPLPVIQNHPDHSADVEEWREYARSKGYQGADVDSMNRAQIRTMLGIVQIPQADGDAS